MHKNSRLKRFDDAYVYATRVTDRNELYEFGRNALRFLEIDAAIRIFRLCGAADMVFALSSIRVSWHFISDVFFMDYFINFHNQQQQQY